MWPLGSLRAHPTPLQTMGQCSLNWTLLIYKMTLTLPISQDSVLVENRIHPGAPVCLSVECDSLDLGARSSSPSLGEGIT